MSRRSWNAKVETYSTANSKAGSYTGMGSGTIKNQDCLLYTSCSELAMSRTLLYNKITQLTGKSPTEFIRIVRLKQAAALLLSGEYSVTDVAFKVGIDNPKYFSRMFKEFYGVSPKEYLAKRE